MSSCSQVGSLLPPSRPPPLSHPRLLEPSNRGAETDGRRPSQPAIGGGSLTRRRDTERTLPTLSRTKSSPLEQQGKRSRRLDSARAASKAPRAIRIPRPADDSYDSLAPEIQIPLAPAAPPYRGGEDPCPSPIGTARATAALALAGTTSSHGSCAATCSAASAPSSASPAASTPTPTTSRSPSASFFNYTSIYTPMPSGQSILIVSTTQQFSVHSSKYRHIAQALFLSVGAVFIFIFSIQHRLCIDTAPEPESLWHCQLCTS